MPNRNTPTSPASPLVPTAPPEFYAASSSSSAVSSTSGSVPTSPLPSPHASIEEIVTCPICMERMFNPKHLHCQHAFCAHCLEDWTAQPGNSQLSICCPVCRMRTPLDDGGVRGLPTDIGITRLLDMLSEGQLQQPMSGSYRGLLCANDGQAAVAFCRSCGHHVCARCVEQHVQTQALWPHLVHLDGHACPQHDGQLQNCHCQRCNRTGCSECLHECRSGGHVVDDLGDVARTNRAAAGYLAQSLRDAVHAAKERPDMVSVCALESRLEQLKQEVEAHANKHQAAVNLWRKMTLSELRQRGDKLTTEVSGVEGQIQAYESLLSFIDAFLEESTDYQVSTVFPSTSQRLHKAIDSVGHLAKRRRTDDYYLSLTVEPPVQSIGRLVNAKDKERGTEVTNVGTGSSVNSPRRDPPPTHSMSSQTMDWEESILSHTHTQRAFSEPRINDHARAQRTTGRHTMDFNISSWENEGVVMETKLHGGPDKDRSHWAAQMYHWLRGQKDEDVDAPVTVFMCNKTGYLYVGLAGWWTPGSVDCYTQCRGLLGGQKVMTDVFPKSMAVSPVDGTIAVCLSDRISFHPNGSVPWRLSNKDKLSGTSVKLPTIRSPHGIAITADDLWVVTDSTHDLMAIYKYEARAKSATHVVTFGSAGSGPRQFKAPTGVCFDARRDQIIVADTGNDRIQVFSASGDYLWETNGSDVSGSNNGRAFKKPRGVCVDGDGNILVADTGNKRIAVVEWEGGTLLTSIDLDFMPFSVTINGRAHSRAEVVIAGLAGKMPVIKTFQFRQHVHSISDDGWWD